MRNLILACALLVITGLPVQAQEPVINGKVLQLIYLPTTLGEWTFAEIDPITGHITPKSIINDIGGVNAFVSAIDPAAALYYQPGLDAKLDSAIFALSTISGTVTGQTAGGNLTTAEFVAGQVYGAEINRIVTINQSGNLEPVISLDISGVVTGISAATNGGFYFVPIDLQGQWRIGYFQLSAGSLGGPVVTYSDPLTVQPVALAYDGSRLVGLVRVGGVVEYGAIDPDTGGYSKIAALPALQSLSQGGAAYDAAGGYFLFPAVDDNGIQRLFVLNGAGNVVSSPAITFQGKQMTATSLQIRSFDFEPDISRHNYYFPMVSNAPQ